MMKSWPCTKWHETKYSETMVWTSLLFLKVFALENHKTDCRFGISMKTFRAFLLSTDPVVLE